MDFVFEFIFELVLEGVFGLTIQNPKLKTRLKTTSFLLFTGAIVAVVICLAFLSANVLVGITGLVLAVLFLYVAVDGHKRGWKQD